MNRNLKALLLKFQVFRDLRDGRSLRAEKESGRYAMVLDYPFPLSRDTVMGSARTGSCPRVSVDIGVTIYEG